MNKRKITLESLHAEETFFLLPTVTYAWESNFSRSRYGIGIIFLKWGLAVILTEKRY